MTSPHNFTLDSKTEKLWEEFTDLARKHRKTVSELIRTFIVDYVEANNPVLEVEVEERYEIPTFRHDRMLTRRTLNPFPEESDKHWEWEERFGRR